MTLTGSGQDVGVEALDAFFARTPRLAVAFSGGCDSSFLLAAALRAGAALPEPKRPALRAAPHLGQMV